MSTLKKSTPQYRVIFVVIALLYLHVVTAEELNESDLYTYKAVVVDVYDGDTITANVDLGFYTWLHNQKLRLARINAPEVRGDEKEQGKAARDWLKERVLDRDVIIQTVKTKKGSEKKGKYGRYIIEIYIDGVNINDELVEVGHAEYKTY